MKKRLSYFSASALGLALALALQLTFAPARAQQPHGQSGCMQAAAQAYQQCKAGARTSSQREDCRANFQMAKQSCHASSGGNDNDNDDNDNDDNDNGSVRR